MILRDMSKMDSIQLHFRSTVTNNFMNPKGTKTMTIIDFIESIAAKGNPAQARVLASKLLTIYQDTLRRCESDQDRQELKEAFSANLTRKL